MAQHDFKGDVHPGLAVKSKAVEPCAILYLYDASKQNFLSILWPALRKHFRLTCAHVKSDDGFSGCIYEFASPEGSCPHKAAGGSAWASLLAALDASRVLLASTAELCLRIAAQALLRARRH